MWSYTSYHRQGPLTCVIVMSILIGEIGFGPALAGMAVVVLVVPLQNHLAGVIGTIRRSMVRHTDERVKLINEILQAIRIIKLYAWEAPMEARVQQCRDAELHTLARYLDINGVLRELIFTMQPVASLVIYMVSLYGYNKPLNQVQMIRVISFLTITRFPLNRLGVALKAYKDATVSLARLHRYLLLPVLHGGNNNTNGNVPMVESPSFEISNAVLSWSEAREESNNDNKEQASIGSNGGSGGGSGAGGEYHSVSTTVAVDKDEGSGSGSMKADDAAGIEMRALGTNAGSASAKYSFALQIPTTFRSARSNELIAIVGSVGSGKSSLISALLGEMPLRGPCNSRSYNNNAGKSGGGMNNAQAAASTITAVVRVHGPISYCAQTPWIQNMSLKNNVLFGLSTEGSAEVQRTYEEALAAACLLPDLRILPDGDLTESESRYARRCL